MTFDNYATPEVNDVLPKIIFLLAVSHISLNQFFLMKAV